MKRILLSGSLMLLAFLLSSCATRPVKQAIPAMEVAPIFPQVSRQDVFHIVAPGETLWRISKMYDVPIGDLQSANGLKTEALKKGQRLLIPSAAPVVPVVPLYPSSKWKFIIIHHSATDEGSSLSFDNYHRLRGWEGIGYHFVIDNGTKEKQDGQIEVSPRWIKQEDGSHCRAGNMNAKAIGICLVGNFNRDNVSPKQLDSLIYLVNRLRREYHIPGKNILGHGQVRGAKTQCPGKNFPWKRFRSGL